MIGLGQTKDFFVENFVTSKGWWVTNNRFDWPILKFFQISFLDYIMHFSSQFSAGISCVAHVLVEITIQEGTLTRLISSHKLWLGHLVFVLPKLYSIFQSYSQVER